MQHRTVFEVMTHDVVTAAPETPFKEIARLFADDDVSAVPVVDADRRLLGVVSEADLLRSTAELPDLEGRWAGVRLLSQERGMPDAETAAQLMTSCGRHGTGELESRRDGPDDAAQGCEETARDRRDRSTRRDHQPQ